MRPIVNGRAQFSRSNQRGTGSRTIELVDLLGRFPPRVVACN